jgi:hypothetical protein
MHPDFQLMEAGVETFDFATQLSAIVFATFVSPVHAIHIPSNIREFAPHGGVAVIAAQLPAHVPNHPIQMIDVRLDSAAPLKHG